MTAIPTIGCYVGFDIVLNTGAWELGVDDLGTGTVLGQEYTTSYTNVGTDVRALTIQRGRSRELEFYPAGRCTVVLDNRGRDYDPLNLSGPYVTGGVTDVKPGRLIYVTATDPTTGTVYRLFTGRINNWALDYVGGFDAVASPQSSDLLADLARVDVAFTSSADDMGAVANEIFAQAGVTQFAYDEGVFQAQAMTWDTNALAALRILEVSEQGALYADENGDVIFASAHNYVYELRSRVSQATFGSGDLTYESISIEYDADDVVNTATLTRQGGVEQSATDADSVGVYGTREYSKTGLANATDGDALAIATHIVSRYADPTVRIKEIMFHPQKNANLMSQALSRKLRDRITVTFSPAGGGSAISQECFITGIKHDIRPQSGMVTTFTLEDAEWSDGWILGDSSDALGTGAVLAI